MLRKIIILFSISLISFITNAQIKLPKLISDGMILQRDVPVQIWGWAGSGEGISVRFNSKIYRATANEQGKWSISLPATKSGGPYQMEFSASNRIVLKDILFGDVFICSEQSNMELAMGSLLDKYPKEIASANYANIRQFMVPHDYDFINERSDFTAGAWESATAKNVLNFSAVAYFFAVNIQKKEHIPIGIINTSVGGSPAQSWISEQSLRQFPDYYNELQKFKDPSFTKTIDSNNRTKSAAWYALLNQKDDGLKNNWKSNDIDFRNWQELKTVGYLPETVFNKQNGVVWLKKVVSLNKRMISGKVKLLLGRLVDADSVFINGKFVGTTGNQYPQRRYLLNEGILKEGQNTLTIRLVSASARVGFVPDKPYMLILAKDTINLADAWKYKTGAIIPPPSAQTVVRWKPAGLFNAMISPLMPFKIKGFLWYQGEANASKSEEYLRLMQTLVADWRKRWAQGNLPFLYVQLPGYMEIKDLPSESNWAKLRVAQSELLADKNTRMAVAIDLGEWNDVHPLNKKEVGERLALQAEQLIYGRQINASSPYFDSVRRIGQQLEISFKNIGKGLMSMGNGPLKGFAIAGEDRKFVWAEAAVKNNRVVAFNSAITNPMYIRYAWADNPSGANLYNKDGLPAAPFEAQIPNK
ncbi:sialate O-acetylesterase [Pedobacter duraquae]|uniref:Sialate O-acetylesterase n=1 Tax=Pedobacter duraquae TaxID=425511 RepID=A0A4R6IKQ2_9SPHI|nr:sialate O-acetylesterase [Pedobacter duraquae]TDO22670.1 sialate O-acetylesterase [Pedobacter duraquae]